MNITTEIFYRKCDVCGRGMNQGYLADFAYFCSDKCLRADYTADEWQQLSTEADDNFYWSEWTEANDPDEVVYTADGVEIAQ